MKKILLLFSTIISCPCFLTEKSLAIGANSSPPALETEFRGMWVANVFNLDWPSRKGMSSSAQKQELVSLVMLAKKLNINAIIFQVRPASDAVYKSSFEPWSPFITGSMGRSPGYDPLSYIINAAHSEGIELHAWFNPFRALASPSISASSNHVTRTHPSLIAKFENKIWTNPGNPMSRRLFLRAVDDVISRYNVDGIHIDDYFYPYPKNVNNWHIDKFPDSEDYGKYRQAGGKLSKLNWRINNINEMVFSLHKLIKSKKPYLRFGISPFGIWQSGKPSGVIAHLDAIRHIHADSRHWLKKGWADYFSPQLYWRMQPRKQSFSALLNWWRKQSSSNTYIWPGIATSRIKSSEDPGRRSSEILNQISITRKIGSSGHIHFSASALKRNKDGIANKLISSVYRRPAPQPPRKTKLNPPDFLKYKPAVKYEINRDNSIALQIKYNPSAWQIAIQVLRQKSGWQTEQVFKPENQISNVRITNQRGYLTMAIAVTAIDGFGNQSPKTVIAIR